MNHDLARTLRFTLLSSLGLLPLGCGGSSEGGKPSCSSPRTDPDGVVACNEGYSYRSQANRCGQSPSDAAEQRSLPSAASSSVDCSADASVCKKFRYGTCKSYNRVQEGGAISICESGCYVDEDCGPNAHCRCDGGATVGSCDYGTGCQSDAECGKGFHCASTAAGCGSSGYACQTADDSCFGKGDCGDAFCVDNGHGHRECGGGSVCGRPFLVQNAQRLPPITPRGDWQQSSTPEVASLSPEARARAAEHWQSLGQMEHASIAAFARFQLQLLALGAPAHLVEACNAALVDETNHARLCFGLASAYAGRALGPGPLDVSRSLELTSLLDIVDLVIEEGCVGETAATLEALEAAKTATDPLIRATYARIAQDEQRHAELAFRFVKWALERDYDAVAERITAALQTRLRARDVVEPCLRALLQSRQAA